MALMVRHGLQARCLKPAVVAIGNFDGMHAGHVALLAQLKQIASESGLMTVVVFFEPQPHEFFSPETAQGRLMRCRDKLAILKKHDIDQAVVLPFHQKVATLLAHDFLHDFLLRNLKMKALLVGNDFRFGRDREGGVDFLRQEQSAGGFVLHVAENTTHQDKRVSSTLVREALENRQLDLAASYLGRPFSIHGRVVRGRQLGRELGFPTLNIPLHRLVPPLLGVYAVTVCGLGDKVLQGAANCGYRPAVQGEGCLLEVFCFDFDKDVYGERVDVVFHHFIREEKDFDSLEDLSKQMEQDTVEVQAYFKEQ